MRATQRLDCNRMKRLQRLTANLAGSFRDPRERIEAILTDRDATGMCQQFFANAARRGEKMLTSASSASRSKEFAMPRKGSEVSTP